MTSPDFSVGSIVYFLAAKTERVLPAQVVERIDRTSLTGIKSTYIIAVKSSSDEIKKIEVDPSKIDLFSSPEDMKSFMVSRATDAIGLLVQQAVEASAIFEPIIPPQEAGVDPDFSEMESWHIPAAERPIRKKGKGKKQSKNQEFAEVDLGNGKTGRLRV